MFVKQIFRIAAAVLLYSVASFNLLSAQLTLQDSLVAYYPLNGDVLDYSGNNNDGYPVNVSFINDRNGNASSAVFLNGTSALITLDAGPKFKPNLPVTISAWVNLQNYNRHIIFHNDYTFGFHRGVKLNVVNGKVWINYGDGGPAGSSWRRSKNSNTTLGLNQWYHVAGVIRGPQDMDIYINGVEDCGPYSGSGGPVGYTSETGGVIGRGTNDTPPPASFFHGAIDDLRFYNRALSAAEIAAMQDAPLGILSADTTICAGETLNLQAAGAPNYSWGPANLVSCTTCPSPTVAPTNTTTFTLDVLHSPNCPTSYTMTVAVEPCIDCEDEPVSALVSLQQNDCDGQVSGLDFSSGPVDSVQVFTGDGSDFPLQPGTAFSHTYAPGTYSLTYYAFRHLPDGSLCADTLIQPVYVAQSLALSVVNLEDMSCFGDSLGSVEVGANGGFPSYQYALGQGPFGNSRLFEDLSDGTYPIYVRDQNGCVDSLSVTVAPSPPEATISQQGDTLIAHPNGGTLTYQWLDSKLAPIPGETDSTYLPPIDDVYYVVITDGDCVDTSEAFFFRPVGLDDSPLGAFALFPNPSQGQVSLVWPQPLTESLRLEVFDLLGRQVYHSLLPVGTAETTFDLGSAAKGTYLLRLSGPSGSLGRKLVKQ